MTAASIAVTAQSVGSRFAVVSVITEATIAVTGSDVGSVFGQVSAVSPASIQITGQSVGSFVQFVSAVLPSSITIVGEDVGSVYTPGQTPTVLAPGGGRQWKEYEDYLARLRQEEEDELILLICQAFVTMEESCELSRVA